MNPPPKVTIPVEAGKVGVFYDATSKVITHYATFPHAGNIVTSLPVILADNQEALKVAIAEAGLTERQ